MKKIVSHWLNKRITSLLPLLYVSYHHLPFSRSFFCSTQSNSPPTSSRISPTTPQTHNLLKREEAVGRQSRKAGMRQSWVTKPSIICLPPCHKTSERRLQSHGSVETCVCQKQRNTAILPWPHISETMTTARRWRAISVNQCKDSLVCLLQVTETQCLTL